jgi:hypothetical protein
LSTARLGFEGSPARNWYPSSSRYPAVCGPNLYGRPHLHLAGTGSHDSYTFHGICLWPVLSDVKEHSVHVKEHLVHVKEHLVHGKAHSVHVKEHSVHVKEHSVQVKEHSVHVKEHSVHVKFSLMETFRSSPEAEVKTQGSKSKQDAGLSE